MSDHHAQNVFARWEQLRVDPDVIKLREDMRAGKEVYACCDEHRDRVRALLSPDAPWPTERELDDVQIATCCKECRLMLAAVHDDLNYLLEE